jgi:GAF domain-containing protein
VALPSPEAAALGLAEPSSLRSVAAVPLVTQGQAIGALAAGAQVALSATQLRLLNALADMAAGAIQRTTQHEKMEQRLQRLAALHTIDVAITSSFDLRVTLSIFLDHLMSQLGVHAAAVLLLNEPAQTLQYAAVRGLSPSVLHQPAPRLSQSPPGQVVLQGQSLYLPRLSEMRAPAGPPYPPSGELFASYYAVPLVARGRVQGVLEVFQRTLLNPETDWVDYLNALATQAAIAIDNATLFNDLQRSNLELNLAYEATIESWARMLEARGIETAGHTRRVADRVMLLGQHAGLSEIELLHLRRGALLHDIGMLSVPEATALKATTYDSTDRSLLQRHPIYGFEILAPIAYLRPAIDIPYGHHERWDGSGYPRQLRGEMIPYPARLFAVVDVWDALVTERPYRAAWPPARARHYLREQAGRLFDPRAVELFMQSEHLAAA